MEVCVKMLGLLLSAATFTLGATGFAQSTELRMPNQVTDENAAVTDADGKSLMKSKRIQHPGMKDGLFLIDEDGVYHYKVHTVSKKDDSMFIRFVSQSPPDISAEIDGKTLVYEDFYGGAQLSGIDFIYEWQPWKNFGKAGLQFGAGLLIANGKGVFRRSTLTEVPRESFTLFSIPLSVGLIYRFEYMNRQWFVPFVSGGGIYNALIEYREDGDMTTVGTPAAYGAGGLMINLTALNRDLAFVMDREYGFSNLWLTAEYRINQSFSEDLDVSSDQISIGIGADY